MVYCFGSRLRNGVRDVFRVRRRPSPGFARFHILQPDPGGGVSARLGATLSAMVYRITSYNVCYTKLLRASIKRSGETCDFGSIVIHVSQLFASPSGFIGFNVIASISANCFLYSL